MQVSTISICVSIVALGLSAFTWRDRRIIDKRDLFLKIHERLLDIDIQHGRRILTREIHTCEDVRRLYVERYVDYETVSRSLSMLDFAALYALKGYIDKRLFLEEWGVVYMELRKHFRLLITERAKDDPSYMYSWGHFQALTNEGIAHAGG